MHHRVAVGGEGLLNRGHMIACGSVLHFNNDEVLPTPKPVLSTWYRRPPASGIGLTAVLAGTGVGSVSMAAAAVVTRCLDWQGAARPRWITVTGLVRGSRPAPIKAIPG